MDVHQDGANFIFDFQEGRLLVGAPLGWEWTPKQGAKRSDATEQPKRAYHRKPKAEPVKPIQAELAGKVQPP